MHIRQRLSQHTACKQRKEEKKIKYEKKVLEICVCANFGIKTKKQIISFYWIFQDQANFSVENETAVLFIIVFGYRLKGENTIYTIMIR